MPGEATSAARQPWLPFMRSIAGYRAGWLRSDASAGLAIAAVGLPSAIAYPAIAGLPPETGLYACIFPLVAYALFGPSRQLIVGPDAPTMTILASVLATVAAATPGGVVDKIAVSALLAVTVGLYCLIARLLRLGVIAAFLSKPILDGFFTGVALSIIIGQLGRMTGVKIEADGLLMPLIELAGKAGEIHGPSLALAGAMFVLLLGLKQAGSRVPGPVVVVLLSVVLSLAMGFEARGIRVVGDIPSVLPSLLVPSPTMLGRLPVELILLGGGAIFLVSFAAGLITARSFGAQAGYPVDANRELVGFGAANIAAGLFGAFPVTASDSRTAVNLSVGGRSQVASLVAAATIAAALLFIGDLLRILPIPALGAILAATAVSLIDLSSLRRLWHVSRAEFVIAIVALLGPLSLGVLNGVVIAIVATLAYLLRRTMAPTDAALGRVPGRDGFYKLHRVPEARAVPGLALCLVQGSVLFINADYVRDRLLAAADNAAPGTRWFVLDAAAISQLDTTGAEMMLGLAGTLGERGIRLGLAELNHQPRELLDRAGVLAAIGADMVFDDLDDALREFTARGAATAGNHSS